jgi:Zn/Cd-binding protein ZinT
MYVPSAAMRSPERLEPGWFYHIYKGSNNREDLLRKKRNYPFYLSL